MKSETFDLILRMRDQATAVWKKTQASISGGLQGLKQSFLNLRSLIAAAFAVKVVKDFIAASNEQEKATAKLNQALKNQGVNSAETLKFMDQLSSQYQKTHGFADDVVTSVQAQIVAMTGLTGKAVIPLVEATLDLAKARNMDALSAADLITKTIAGQDALGRYGISVKHAKNETEKMSEVVRIIRQQFGGMAENEVKTASGQLQQLSLTWADLQEDIGGVLKEALIPVAKFLEENMPVIRAAVISFAEGANAAFYSLVGSIAFLGQTWNEFLALINQGAIAISGFTTGVIQEQLFMVAAATSDAQQKAETWKDVSVKAFTKVETSGDAIREAWEAIGATQKKVNEEGVVSQGKLKLAVEKTLDPMQELSLSMKRAKEDTKFMMDALLQMGGVSVKSWTDMQHEELAKQLGDYRESKMTEMEILTQWHTRAQEMAAGNDNFLTEIERVHRERKAELDLQTARKAVQQIQQITSQATNVLLGFSKNKTEAEIAGIEERRDAQLQAIDEQLASEALSEEQRNLLLDKRKALENDFQNQMRAAKQRQFDSEKQAAIINSIIQTAVAVAEALPNIPLSLVVGALGAAQTAVIAGQPTPRFQQGTPPGGFIVPPGFPNDGFPVRVSSGERVDVTPAGERAAPPSITIIQNFNGPTTRDIAELAKKGVEEVLRRTGLPIDKAFVRNPESLQLG